MGYYFQHLLWNFILRSAIKTCEVKNEDNSQNLFLIQDFCETDESGPLVRKNPFGKFSNIFIHHLLNTFLSGE